MNNNAQLSKLVNHLNHEQLQELVKLCRRKLEKNKCKNKDDKQQGKMAKLKKKRTILKHCVKACVNKSTQKHERFKIEKLGKRSEHIDQEKVTETNCDFQPTNYENVDKVNPKIKENKVVHKHVETVADPNAQCKFGFSPLIHAIQDNNKTLIQTLLASSRVDINIADRNGYTPLMWAADLGLIDL